MTYEYRVKKVGTSGKYWQAYRRKTWEWWPFPGIWKELGDWRHGKEEAIQICIDDAEGNNDIFLGVYDGR